MGRPRSLAHIANPVARRALGRNNAILGALIEHWADIVGRDVAGEAIPEKLSRGTGSGNGATLHIKASPGAAIGLQHKLPMLQDRLDTVLGRGAVGSIRISQGKIGGTSLRRKPPRPPLAANDRATLDTLVAGISDPALKRLLFTMGERIYSRR